MERLLKIDNCLDCPRHDVVDSQRGGVDVICTAMALQHVGRYAIYNAKPIYEGGRWAKRSQTLVPGWCPLPLAPEDGQAKLTSGQRPEAK